MTIRWGIAGAGKISHDFVTALRTLPKDEKYDVVAVAAREHSRAAKFAELHTIEKCYEGYEKLAKDQNVDIVYVGTLNPQHYEVAKMMLEGGKHVLCEKPLTMNLKQATRLTSLAKEKNLFLMEAVWSRCFPIYEEIEKAMNTGQIGEVHQVLVSFGFKMPHVERLRQKRLGGGTVLDLGVYGLQFASLIFRNEMPRDIRAAGSLNEDGVDLSASVSLVYEGSRTATIVTHSLVDLPNEAYVIGSQGMIRVPNFWCPTSVELPSGTLRLRLPDAEHSFNFLNSAGLRYEAAEVHNCLRSGKTESSKVPHALSLLLATLEDEIRMQIGVVYPEDSA